MLAITIVGISSALADPLPHCLLATNTQLLCEVGEGAADAYFHLGAMGDPDVKDPYHQRLVREHLCIVTHERAGTVTNASRLASGKVAEPRGAIRVLLLDVGGRFLWEPGPQIKGTCPRYIPFGDRTPVGFIPARQEDIHCAKPDIQLFVRRAAANPDTMSDRDFDDALAKGKCFAAPAGASKP